MEDVVNYCRLCLKKRGIKHELFDPKSGAESHGNVILNLMGVAVRRIFHIFLFSLELISLPNSS